MKITITGRKVNLRDNFKELAKKKLSRFDRIFDEDAQANVVVTVERNRQTVEITIRNRGIIFRAESTDFEMNAALDQYVEEYLHSQEEDDTQDYQIVRTKHFFVKPMTTDEAILQMNLLDHQFFLFRNEDNGAINVVYKRKDGNYGLLEPDVE